MAAGNVKLAIKTLRTAKWRSLLTMMGIIIGVVSVVTIVSLGEGVKRQVAAQAQRVGEDLITVRPGTPLARDISGIAQSLNAAYGLGFGSGSLSEQDFSAIRQTKGVKTTVPLTFVTGSPKTAEREYLPGYVLGTTPDFPEVLNQEIRYGGFFGPSDIGKHVAVIGKNIAEQLFEENIPIGRIFTLRGTEFIVRGVFQEFENTPVTLGADFNSAVFIPYEISNEIGGGSTQLVQAWVKPEDPGQTAAVQSQIRHNLGVLYDGQSEFTVFRQSESLAASGGMLDMLTGFVAALAAISLLVGGIGIMNIMLVSVTERTKEIGIRKAIGATNRQLLNQFLMEAVVLCAVGGLAGVILALLVNYLLRVLTNLNPVISLTVIGIATVVSVVVGVIFGIAPAIKAARKDPIEALRSE